MVSPTGVSGKPAGCRQLRSVGEEGWYGAWRVWGQSTPAHSLVPFLCPACQECWPNHSPCSPHTFICWGVSFAILRVTPSSGLPLPSWLGLVHMLLIPGLVMSTESSGGKGFSPTLWDLAVWKLTLGLSAHSVAKRSHSALEGHLLVSTPAHIGRKFLLRFPWVELSGSPGRHWKTLVSCFPRVQRIQPSKCLPRRRKGVKYAEPRTQPHRACSLVSQSHQEASFLQRHLSGRLGHVTAFRNTDIFHPSRLHRAARVVFPRMLHPVGESSYASVLPDSRIPSVV